MLLRFAFLNLSGVLCQPASQTGCDEATAGEPLLQSDAQMHRVTHTSVRCSPSVPHTECPKLTWVDTMVMTDPSPGKIFMDVGCNKGNDAIAWMERWHPTANVWSVDKWTNRLDADYPNKIAYACGVDSKFERAADHRHAGDNEPLNVVVCVEPMQANVDMLRHMSTALGYANSSSGSFIVVQKALTDSVQPGETVEFGDGAPGDEMQQLSALQTPVPMSTVDGLVAELGLARVDILTIDVEGHDPAVLRGAARTLASTRYLQFEVHRDMIATEWGKHTLRSVVSDLDQKGFECYWAGNNGELMSISACWSDEFELGSWANAACVKRGDVWASVLESHAQASSA